MNSMNKNFFSSAAVAFSLLLAGCGQPYDRNATVNPKIEPKLISLKNISDVSAGQATVYSQLKTGEQVNASSTSLARVLGGKVENSNVDTNKILNSVTTENKKAFLKEHLNEGGVVAFSMVHDTVRILALVEQANVAKIAKSDVQDLTLEDINDAKAKRIAKTDRILRVRKSDPANSARFVEVAAIVIEKSGALESEKTDYNETKPTLNILTNLPMDMSTHAILASESKEASDKAVFDVKTVPAAGAATTGATATP